MPSNLLPDPGVFDPFTDKPNSNINRYTDLNAPAQLPTWYPDQVPRDAQLCRIADCEVNGEFTRAHNSSKPAVLESVSHAAHAESEALLGAASLVTPRRRPPY
jgi:hypothetical protein